MAKKRRLESLDYSEAPQNFDKFIEWLKAEADRLFQGEARENLEIDFDWGDCVIDLETSYEETQEEEAKRMKEQSENIARVQMETRDRDIKEMNRLKEIYE